MPRAIVLLAVPMVLEMAMESIFAVVDIFFVSRLGSDAMAAVGFTEALLTVVYTVAMGLGIGVTAIVARRVGERNPAAASDATFQAVVLGVGVSLVLGVLGVWFAGPLQRVMMGANEAVITQGAGYTRVMFGGNAVVLLLFLLNAAFRGAAVPGRHRRVLHARPRQRADLSPWTLEAARSVTTRRRPG